MLFDDPEDLGRAFGLTVPGSIFHLTAVTAKEAECWVRVFKIILEMNNKQVNVTHQNPFVFETQNMLGNATNFKSQKLTTA